MEEKKKQEEEKLQRIEEIEQKRSDLEASPVQNVISPAQRVQVFVAEDSEMDDKDERLAALESKIFALDMSYQAINTMDKDQRQLKPQSSEENKEADPE